MRVTRLPSTPLQWLIVAAVLHVLTALICFLLGYFAFLPQLFDRDGLATGIAVDNLLYRTLQLELVQTLHNSGWNAWTQVQVPLHTRFYSLCYAGFGKILGYNILAAEPLNLFYFLATLSFVYLLGREIFSERAGLLAAIVVAVWPSMLLQSAQIIRDPFSNMCLLGITWLLTKLIAKELTWRQSFTWAMAIVATIALLWLARGNIWSIIVIALFATLILLAVKTFLLKRFITTNTISLVVVIVIALAIPSQLESMATPERKPPVAALSLQSTAGDMGPFTRLVSQIGNRRAAFHSSYAARGSNIDDQVTLRSVSDILKYLPRAVAIGFLAPFPNMWLQAGAQAGRSGRLMSGVEMLLIYLMYVAVIVALWSERQRLAMWLSFTVAAAGIVGLGVIVANVGALYRLRYAFWMMLIVIGAQGLLMVREHWKSNEVSITSR